ncbi:amidase family protein [Paracoccus sp. Ld10]|uniref:amidase family protein n=1 Tax=Paracoccus sp. Ld10 TaxID=649158 RepID=UPI003865C4CF
MTPLLSRVTDALERAKARPDRSAIFTQLDATRILSEARHQQARADAGEDLPLFGILISVKDLFDEAGQVTGAGSRLLATRSPATEDSTVVARLRHAGAVMFGRTSMSEFAYSGVGLNPHHGTPSSVLVPGVIPGGSSSGGAVSVGLGLVDAAIGTDTGGSLRIPATANGLWGMKPSQGLIPDAGIHPLAPSYDTPGPMARDADTLCRVLSVMAGARIAPQPAERLRLAVPQGAFTNDLSRDMAEWFDRETARLSAAGHHLQPVDMARIGAGIGLNRIIVAVEAHRLYAADLDRLQTLGDPRVLSRIRFAETLSAQQIDDAYAERADLVRVFRQTMEGFDALLAPALSMMPPTIAAVEADFDRLNAAMLRNTSLVNLIDGCAIVFPSPGATPAWSLTMLAGVHGADAALIGAALRLSPAGVSELV